MPAQNTYSITIKNRSLKPQSFMLFQALPKPANVPQNNVFTNVYQRAVQIVGNAQAQASFQISSECFAVYGTSNKSEDGMVKIDTSDYREVKLGPKGSRFYLSTQNSDGESPVFQKEDQSTDAGGAFIVSSDRTFSNLNPGNMYFGVGAKVPGTDAIIPIQTYEAQPGVVAQIFPKVKYYIAFGHYEPGTIVDMSQLGDVLSIDFTGSADHNATFTLDSQNDYIPDKAVTEHGIKWVVRNAV
ncbi:hypothetical protein K4K54_007333 [Colletotrichum sp. SAR 10_86]|nr:hypothetical protein K4K54_007333 [Colletotrichum sp. SAR 10_86]